MCVGADPEPDDQVILFNAEGSPPDADTDGIDVAFGGDALEVKAGVFWIVSPESIVASGRSLDVVWQSAKTFEEFWR